MEILEVDAKTFGEIIPEPYFVFGSAAFTKLNRKKADAVHYLLFREGKYRLGITGGVRDKVFYSPFSAPFGGFVFLNPTIKLPHIDDALKAFSTWAMKKGLKKLSITLPPEVYTQNFIAKQISALYRAGFSIRALDLNFSFPMEKFKKEYLSMIWRNARKNYATSLKAELTFHASESLDEWREAYDIIEMNRQTRGFPLRMDFEDLMETRQLIRSDAFMVRDNSNKAIGSAIVFYVSENTVRIIYWGDLPEFSAHRTMNFLAYNLFAHYKKMDIANIDLGISTVDSVPNHGLCEFKESIGCEIQPQMNFSKQL
jgi:hypothetical protein